MLNLKNEVMKKMKKSTRLMKLYGMTENELKTYLSDVLSTSLSKIEIYDIEIFDSGHLFVSGRCPKTNCSITSPTWGTLDRVSLWPEDRADIEYRFSQEDVKDLLEYSTTPKPKTYLKRLEKLKTELRTKTKMV